MRGVEGSSKKTTMEPQASGHNGARFGKELGDLVKKVEAWSAHVATALRDTKDVASSVQVAAQEDVDEIIGRLGSLEAEDQFIQRVREEQQEELSRCEQESAEVYKNLEELSERTKQLFQLKTEREALISKSMGDITGKLNQRKQKVKALLEATGWYKQLLSMRCEYSDAVKFIITNVDPHDPERVFSFSIRLDKSTNSWSMVDCNPRVEGSASLVESLNQTNEFSRFVRSMRREFEVLAMRSRYQTK